ncbi:unnamed protein product (macronuclear) [Paramecium tetraurelia]|uniref:Uncharacterized protein n=1 Tax=Paramecium tetraurelia TaxID=5888 RepID=A0CJ10_PARTE|nr:uncharacterized protein GSPATT00007912001 [Paramecium tetraurelia]CAK70777.1 unnamed protein product [Paramecium tetraurelia]|eukprot:XP_001438174.1 hypothetical protein (macronuclear) [Paramecium tetraurelia strain d4-2]
MNSQENVAGVKTRSMKVCDNMVEITAKRVYCHISKAKKTQLVQTVLKQKCKIKKIAKDLNINYATAKTILHCYKKKEINLNDDSQQKRASYSSIKNDPKLYVQIRQGEKIINHYEYFDVIKRHQ